MIPGFCLTRLNNRYNTMTCKTKCNNCKCKPCDHLPVDDNLYEEVDDKTFLPSTTDPRN